MSGTVRRQARSAPRRQAILDAALTCFDEYGYEPTSIQDIRERSGASVGSIYHHFGDKEGIAAALYVNGITEYQRAILNALGEDTAQGIRAVAGAHLAWAHSNRALARFLDTKRDLEVTLASEGALREANARFGQALRAWITPRIRAGELADLPLDVYVALLIGPPQMFMRARREGSRGSSTRRVRALLGDAAWAALAGPAARR